MIHSKLQEPTFKIGQLSKERIDPTDANFFLLKLALDEKGGKMKMTDLLPLKA